MAEELLPIQTSEGGDEWDKYKVKPAASEKEDWSQYAVKKKVSTPVLGNTLPSFQNGSNSIPLSQVNTDLPLSPVLPQARQEVAQQQQAQATAFSDRLKDVYNAADPELKKELNKVPSMPKGSTVSATPQDEIDHMNFMNSTTGKILAPLAYLGSKAGHGGLQIAKGVAHLANMAQNPAGNPVIDQSIDQGFAQADKAANLGLSEGDISKIEDGKGMGNHALSSLGMLAEFAPAIAGGEAAAGTKLPAALMYLQGVGAGKDMADKIEGLNPVAKEALIQGSGVVNLALTDLGGNLFGKGVSSAVKDKVVAGIAADVIKDNAGKQISSDTFQTLLKNGAQTFADKFERAPMEALKHYTDAAKTFATLDVGNFAVHKAVDKINEAEGGQAVFNENAGTLAENLNRSMTQSVPTFGTLGAIGALSKLSPNSSYENDVVKSVMNDSSPENVDAIKQQIHDHGFNDQQVEKWTPEQMDATFKHVDKIADAARSLPSSIADKNKPKAIGLVLDRNVLQEELKGIQDAKTSLDPAVQDVVTPKEQYLTDKIEQANDKLRDVVTGKRTTYSKGVDDKEEGKVFKTTDGTKEEITPSRYDLENTEREAKKQSIPDVQIVDHVGEDTVQPTGKQITLDRPNEQTEPNQEIPAEQPADETGSVPQVAETVNEASGNNEVKTNEPVNTDTEAKAEAPIAEKPKEPTLSAVQMEGSNNSERLDVGPPTSDPVRQKAIDAITHGIVGDGERQPGDTSPRFDLGMDTRDQKRAIRDITNGNYDTAPAKKMIYKVSEFEKNGEYPVIEGQGGSSVRNRFATPDEIQQHIDDAKQFKLAKEQDIEANNNGLKDLGITHQDIQDYENYRNAGEPGTIADNGRTISDATKDVQRPEDEQAASVPQSTGGEATQGKQARTPSLSDDESARKLELRKKFSGQLNDVTRIPTLLADKEFREYAGLIFKEASGDFKAFSKELIDNVGEKIKEHLPALFKELGGKEPSEEPIGITKEETRKQREVRGLENLPESDKTTLAKMFESGKESVDNNSIDPRKLAAEVSEKPRNLSPNEVNALLYDRQRIRLQLDDVRSDLEVKINEPDHLPETAETLRDRQRYLEESLDNNERALRAGANQNALALVAMRNMINSDYTHATQQARMRSLAGGKLTPEMEKELDRYSKELDEANKRLADYEKQFAEIQAKKVYDKERVAQRKAAKGAEKENLKTERKTLVKDFLKEMEKARKAGMLSSDIPYRRELAIAAPFIKKMLTNLAKEGIVEFKDVIATIHENFAEHIDGLKDRDIMDVLAGKYNERKETKNQLLEQKNALIKLSRLTGKLEDLKKGLETEKSEKRLVQKRNEIAKLETEIKEIEKAHSEALRPERERQSYIKQLKKGIADIEEQIAAGEKVKPSEDKYADDTEIKKLREERSAKVDELNEIDPSQKQQSELSAAIKATEKSISDLEERLDKKDLHPEKKVPKDYNSPELTKLREKRDRLSKQLEQLKKDEFTPEERKKQSLQRQLNKITGRIQSGDFSLPEQKEPLDIDHEMITLQSKVKKAHNNFDAMAERLGNHTKTKAEKVLDTYTQIRRAMLLSGVKTLGKLYSFAALRSATTPIEEVVNSVNSRIPLLQRIAQRSPRFSKGFTGKAEAEAISTRWSKATLKDSWVDVLKTGTGELDRLYGKNGVDKDFDLNPSALEFFGRLHGAFKNSTKRAEFFRSFQKRLEYAASKGLDINDPNVQFANALDAYADGKRAILMNDNILVDKGYKSLLRGVEMGGSLSGKAMATAIRALFPIVKIPTNYVLETYDAVTGVVPGLSRATPYIAKAMIHGAESLSPKQADMVMRTLAKGQIGLAAMVIAYNNPQMFGGYYSGKRDGADLKAGDIVIDGHKLPHWMAHNPYFEAMQVAATMRRAIDEANGNGAPEGIMNQLTTKRKDEISALAQEKADKKNPNTQLVEVKDGKTFYNVYLKGDRVSSITKEGGVKEGVKNSASGLAGQIPFTSVGDIIDNQKTTGNLVGEMARNQIEPRLLQESAEFTDKDKNGEAIKRDPQGFTDQLKVGVPELREQVQEKSNPADKKVSILKLKNGDQYPLSNKQIEERKTLIDDYIKEHGADIREKFKNKGLTDHDVEQRVQKAAIKYSKNILWQKYKDQLQLQDDE